MRKSAMSYQRKTYDEFEIQQHTGAPYGWETVCAEETFKKARDRRKEYRKKRIKKEIAQ